VAIGGELWGSKRCGSKPPLETSTIACLYRAQYKRAECGNNIGIRPRPDPKEKSVNERRIIG
jgi:hypothetical protein